MTSKKLNNAWNEYLSVKPTTRDIALIFFCNDQEGICELAWKELKSRKDKENEDIIMPILYCRGPRWVKDEAWEMLSERSPSPGELERIASGLHPSDPIVKDIIKTFGVNKEYLLQKVKEASVQ